MNKKQIVLIVDDTPENLQVLGNILESQGYEVMVAANGQEAIANARTIPSPDIVLLDIMMPGMDGYEVCRRLKADPDLKRIPVIFISALGMPEQKIQGFKEGGVDYITKPFQAEEVMARVQTHLKLVLVDELTHEISERKKVEENLLQSVREKETLIRELYHRTKNTMQVILGMLVLQADEYPGNEELKKVVKITEGRIQSISLVHQLLYKSRDLSRISIKEYIHELSDLIIQGMKPFNDNISLNLKISEQYFLLDTAIPIGLILNELMTNSLKYAFPDNRKGEISISLSEPVTGKFIFLYSDNGIGVPDNFDFKKQNTLGLKLIYNVALQLNGKLKMYNDKGIYCTLEFQNNLYESRV